MTLTELNFNFFKAHLLMVLGIFAGELVAVLRCLRHPLLFGILCGLLLSAHIYRRCIIALIKEYKHLKDKHNNENKNIS